MIIYLSTAKLSALRLDGEDSIDTFAPREINQDSIVTTTYALDCEVEVDPDLQSLAIAAR